MGNKGWFWLIGAKIVCCGTLLLMLTGALSLGAIGAFLGGNALPLAGAAVASVAATLFLRHRPQRSSPERRALWDDPQPEPRSRAVADG